MRAFFKIKSLCLVFICFSACIIEDMGPRMYLGSKDSCGFAVSRYTGEGVRWNREDFPVSFYIHESVPYSAMKTFLSSMEHWNMVWEEHLEERGLESFTLFEVVSESTRYKGSPGNDGYNMLFFETEDFSPYDTEKVQAITAMSSSRRKGRIKDTDIIVNAVNYRYYYDEAYSEEILLSKNKMKNSRAVASSRGMGFWFELQQSIKRWFQFLLKPFQKRKPLREIAKRRVTIPRDQVDFPSLMIHELGHVPGLDHFDSSDSMRLASGRTSQRSERRGHSRTNTETHSVMEPKLADGRVRRDIGEYDLDNMLCGYFNL